MIIVIDSNVVDNAGGGGGVGNDHVLKSILAWITLVLEESSEYCLLGTFRRPSRVCPVATDQQQKGMNEMSSEIVHTLACCLLASPRPELNDCALHHVAGFSAGSI